MHPIKEKENKIIEIKDDFLFSYPPTFCNKKPPIKIPKVGEVDD